MLGTKFPLLAYLGFLTSVVAISDRYSVWFLYKDHILAHINSLFLPGASAFLGFKTVLLQVWFVDS